MEDNIENQQIATNPIEEIKFSHEGSVQVGCSTGVHELEITKLLPGADGMTEVLLMCRRCGDNFSRNERLNINDILGGVNNPLPAIVPQPIQPIGQNVSSSPQQIQQPQVAPISPTEIYKDADSFWESIKKGSR